MRYDPVNEMTKRTQRYWYEDGIWEMSFGLINLILGLFFLITAPLDWTGPRAILLLLLQMIVIVGPFLLINRVVAFLKERITYPRTGYVAYRRPAPGARAKRFMLGGLIGASVAALVVVISAIRASENSMPLVISLVMAAMLIYLGYRFGLLRCYILAVLTVVWGYLLSQFPLPDLYETGAFFCGFGFLVLVSGAVTLIVYLRQTRPAGENLLDHDLPENHSGER
jgi:hypothetical protein